MLLSSVNLKDVLLSILDIFTFGDLRNIKCVESLDPNSKLSNILNLFCFGTYGDHKNPSFPSLSAAQLRKLRQLTIISACEYRHHIPYDVLLKSLELTSLRELEDLIIDLIYADAIVGKLDQQKRILVVESVIARDFKQEDVSHSVIKFLIYLCSYHNANSFCSFEVFEQLAIIKMGLG